MQQQMLAASAAARLASQAKRKASALARQQQQLQSVTSVHVTAASNAKAAVAAADRSQPGQLELLVAKAETVCAGMVDNIKDVSSCKPNAVPAPHCLHL